MKVCVDHRSKFLDTILKFYLIQSVLWPTEIHVPPLCKIYSPFYKLTKNLIPSKHWLKSKISQSTSKST